jgi:hypothetical protein
VIRPNKAADTAQPRPPADAAMAGAIVSAIVGPTIGIVACLAGIGLVTLALMTGAAVGGFLLLWLKRR